MQENFAEMSFLDGYKALFDFNNFKILKTGDKFLRVATWSDFWNASIQK